jgi:phosphatidylinositol alpha 1,6-mannosyltransferase
MRVLYCTDTYPPQVNGVSVVTSLSVEGLRERGWDCHVIAPQYPDARPSVFEDASARSRAERAEKDAGARRAEEPDGRLTALPSIPLPIYPDVRLSLPDYGRVRRAIARAKPDLVHCETEFIIGRMGQAAALRSGIPFVTSYHTDFAKYVVAYGYPRFAAPVSSYLARFHRRALRTYTPSVPARDELWRLGVEDVEVWGRGVDTARFHPEFRSAELRSQLGLGDAFTFLYVGRVASEKGVDVVIEAFGRLEAVAPPGAARLVIAGEGPDLKALRAHAPPGIVFLGYLDRARDLPALYASADAFVFASTTETLGLVVLEAMASGLPVVASPAGGVSDHLRDNENGLACAPGDAEAFARAMSSLISDAGLAARLSEGARLTAEARTWARELDRLDESYREVCAETVAWRSLVPLQLQGTQ